MQTFGELWRRIVFLLRFRTFDRELAEEMQFHLAMKAHSGGARREFGNETLLKEASRDMWGWSWLEHFFQDVRFAFRMIRRSPVLSGVAILSLALGIGANTAIFSLIDTVLLRTLPVKDPAQLALLCKRLSSGTIGHIFSYPALRLFREKNHSIDGLLAFSGPEKVRMSMSDGVQPEQVTRGFVSGNFFDVLGVTTALGRTFTGADDAAPGAAPYAVLNYDYWSRRFASDPGVIGRRLVVDEVPLTVIGVAQRGFRGVEPGYEPDMWVPAMMMEAGCVTSPGCQDFAALIRLRPGVPREQVVSELDVLHRQHLTERAARIRNDFARKSFLNQRILLQDGRSGFSPLGADFSRALFVLMAAVGAVLLIACANVANLLLARATARRREVAVRLAIGAGRFRLIRQLLTESSVLAALGGAAGLWIAYWGGRILVAFVARPGSVVVLDLKPDVRMLAFTAAVSILSGLLFGLAPAFRATRSDLALTLKENARGVAGASGRLSLGKLLVAVQVAVSLVLLVGGGLFVRSLQNLRVVDTGYNPKNVLMFTLSMPRSYAPSQVLAVNQRAMEELKGLPGVVSAGTISPPLLSSAEWDDILTVEGYAARPSEDLDTHLMSVSRDFFSTMQIPLLAGRRFGPGDTANSGKVALINESMARRFFGDGSPIGRHFTCSLCGGRVEIAGVVRDSMLLSLREAVPTTAFLLNEQASPNWGAFLARTSGNPRALFSALSRRVKNIDPAVLVDRPRRLTDQLDEVLLEERMIADLSGFFAALGLLLASIGLYGVMSYAVARSTNEIGIRMALGAGAGAVIRLVLAETAGLVAVGLAVGAAGALSLTQLVGKMLFGLKPADPLNMLSMIGLLLAAALLAGYLPARRATRVDPVVTLRYE